MRPLLTSRASALRPLVVQGQRVLDLHQALSRLLAARTGDAAMSLLLASPRVLARRDEIVWDTAADGEAVRLADADAGTRADGEARFAAAFEAARGVVEALRHDDARKRDAAALEAALSHPGAGDRFLVGGAPVLVNWGCAPAASSDAADTPVRTVRRVAETPLVTTPGEVLAARRGRPEPDAEPKLKPRQEKRPSKPFDPWPLAWAAAILLAIAVPFGVRAAMTPPAARLAAERSALQGGIGRLRSLAGDVAKARLACATQASQDASIAGRLAAAKVPANALATLAWSGAGALELSMSGPPGTADFVGGGSDPDRRVAWFTAKGPAPKGHFALSMRLDPGSPPLDAPTRWDMDLRPPGQPARHLGGYLRPSDGRTKVPVTEFDAP